MKVSTKSLVSLCAVGFLASGLVVAETNENATVVIKDNSCTMFSENGFVTGEGSKITTNSANGNISLTCFMDMEGPTSTGRSIIYNKDSTGFPCTVSGYPTDDWHQVTSRSGKAQLSCHYHD